MTRTSPSHSLQLLISRQEIERRVSVLAREISLHYENRPLTLLGVMTGSLFFLTDLMRHLTIPHQVGVIQASSYEGHSTEPGELRTNLDYLPDLQNRSILLVDDILDTGQTLTCLQNDLSNLTRQDISHAVLLWKKSRTETGIEPDFLGFEIENHFVVGYGLDYADDYRHLPDIHTLNFFPNRAPRKTETN